MMKTHVSLFFLILLWSMTIIISSVPAAEAVTVRVIHGLSDRRKRMLVHCKSGDDDIGNQYIVAGGDDYHFDFSPNIWGTTLFWCYVAPDANTHTSFTAWADDDPLIPAGNLADVTWLAKDDGMYVKRRIRNEKNFSFYRKWSYGKQ